MVKKKKIILYFSGDFAGGAEYMMLNLAPMLKRHEYEPIYVLSGQGEVYELLDDVPNVYQLKVKSYLNKFWPFPYLLNCLKLFFLIKKTNADLILVEGKPLTQVSTISAILAGIPCISYVHFPPGEYEVKRMFYHFSTKIMLCCDALKSYFIGNSKIDKEQLVSLPNYVDNKKFKLSRLADTEDELVTIVLVGHLSKVKGQECLIEATKKLIDQSCKIKILFAGKDNSEDLKNENRLKKITKGLGLENEIVFLGKVSNVSEVLESSDIFVLPSYKEGMPLVILEAMAAGLPVIASTADGNKDAVVDNETGFLIEAGDVDGLVKKLKLLIDNRNLRVSMGEAGRKRVSENFTPEVYESKLINIINKLV